MTILLVSPTSTTALLVGLFLLMASACCGAPCKPCPDSIQENQPCKGFDFKECPGDDGTIWECVDFNPLDPNHDYKWNNTGLYDGFFPHPGNSCEHRKDNEEYYFPGEKRCSDLTTSERHICNNNGKVFEMCGFCQENTNSEFEVHGEDRKMKCDDLRTKKDYDRYCMNGAGPASGICGICKKETKWKYRWDGARRCDALITEGDRENYCQDLKVRSNCPKTCKSYPCCPVNEPKAGISKCGSRRSKYGLVCGYGDYKSFKDSDICQPKTAYECSKRPRFCVVPYCWIEIGTFSI